jgi:glycosyltransferase involved in cell wall biosynthesis
MKVLFLTQFDECGASSRCRVHQYLPGLRERGIEACALAVLPPARDLARRARAVDVVYVQKRRLPLSLLLRLRRAAAALVFDFDDAIWLQCRPGREVRPAPAIKRLRLAALLRLSDRVVAGNSYLAAYARRFNRSVTILPTPVDLSRFAPVGEWATGGRGDGAKEQGPSYRPVAPSPTRRVATLGWVGHPDNLVYLRGLEPVFGCLAREFPELTLQVVSTSPYGESALRVENVTWSLAGASSCFQGFDIGLMPLPDDAWTRGKCAYKALEYMAAGVPAVCSPVGMNQDVIQDGETGFLAAGPAAWEEALRRLIGHPALRARVGEAGRAAVRAGYSLSQMTDRLAEELQRVQELSRKGRRL